jgi:hypothetical protein
MHMNNNIDENKYLGMINTVVRSKTLHYSTSYHITHSQQRLADINKTVCHLLSTTYPYLYLASYECHTIQIRY